MGRRSLPRPEFTPEQIAARNELAMSCVALVWQRIKRKWLLVIRTYGLEERDAVQECMVALLKAAEKYEPTRAKFTTLAALTIEQTLSDLCRPRLRKRLWGTSVDGDSFAKTGWRPRESEEERLKPSEYRLDDALKRLSHRDQEVLHLCFWDGLKLEDVGARYGMSKRGAAYFRRRACNRLKLELERLEGVA